MIAQPLRICAASSISRIVYMPSPLQQLTSEVLLASLIPLPELLVPGEKAINPGLDRVFMPSQGGDREPTTPAIVDEEGHRDLVPLSCPRTTVPEHGHDDVVTVAEDISGHHHFLTNCPLDGKSAAVNLGGDTTNDDPGGRLDVHIVASRPVCRWHD
jgi:hypothetical protein